MCNKRVPRFGNQRMLRRKTRRVPHAKESTLPGIRMKASSMLGVARVARLACLLAGLMMTSVFAAEEPAASILESAKSIEVGPGRAHFSKDLNGGLETDENLTLR